MTLIVALCAGIGALLTASPFLWPRHPGASAPSRGLSAALSDSLARAGLPQVSPAMVVAVSAILALATAGAVYGTLPVIALAVASGIVAGSAPFLAISRRASARRRAATVVWPDVVDHLVSAVRSGLALPDSVLALAHTGPHQTRESFATFERAYTSTGNFGVALDELKGLIADPVADRIIETLRMSREVGGTELTSVLRSLASYLRQEAAIRAEIEARQSWVVNAARLGVAAPWIVLLLLSSRPEAATAYNSPAGLVLIIGGLGVSTVAFRIMIGLGKLPQERRWFA